MMVWLMISRILVIGLFILLAGCTDALEEREQEENISQPNLSENKTAIDVPAPPVVPAADVFSLALNQTDSVLSYPISASLNMRLANIMKEDCLLEVFDGAVLVHNESFSLSSSRHFSFVPYTEGQRKIMARVDCPERITMHSDSWWADLKVVPVGFQDVRGPHTFGEKQFTHRLYQAQRFNIGSELELDSVSVYARLPETTQENASIVLAIYSDDSVPDVPLASALYPLEQLEKDHSWHRIPISFTLEPGSYWLVLSTDRPVSVAPLWRSAREPAYGEEDDTAVKGEDGRDDWMIKNYDFFFRIHGFAKLAQN